MKSFFAVVGFVVVVLYALGVVGIGNFVFYYGPKKSFCVDLEDGNSFQLNLKDVK
jgi:hypothetical protein